MASDGVPVNPPVTRLVQVSQASIPAKVQKAIGKPLLTGGRELPAAGRVKAVDPAEAAKSAADLRALIAHLNKHFNDSGQPIQFRVDPASESKIIQEINPASGEVVGEYSAAEFPALARGLGVFGLVVDKRA
jgi:uncharacterized FlaG/YvyC family protein